MGFLEVFRAQSSDSGSVVIHDPETLCDGLCLEERENTLFVMAGSAVDGSDAPCKSSSKTEGHGDRLGGAGLIHLLFVTMSRVRLEQPMTSLVKSGGVPRVRVKGLSFTAGSSIASALENSSPEILG